MAVRKSVGMLRACWVHFRCSNYTILYTCFFASGTEVYLPSTSFLERGSSLLKAGRQTFISTLCFDSRRITAKKILSFINFGHRPNFDIDWLASIFKQAKI